jgi:predicted nucleotidyltransferase
MVSAEDRNRKKMIREMVNRIVEHFDPERIILFGSQARGEAGPESDVDLLVVMPVQGSKREKQLEIRALLRGIRLAKDIVVSRPEEFAWRKDIVGTIEYPATKEGKVLYARDRESNHRRRRVG